MIAARLRQIADATPEAPALIDANTTIGYAELVAAIGRVRSLLESRGAKPEDIVAASLPNGLAMVASFLACVDLGAIFLPVNPAWRTAELSWLLQQGPPQSVILASGDKQRWLDSGLPPERIEIADGEGWPRARQAQGFGVKSWPHDHPAACICTSGSTGRPRIAVKTHGGMSDTARGVAEVTAIGPGNRLLAAVPPHHGHGLSNNLVLPLLTGAALVLLEPFEPIAAAESIERNAVDYVIASPVFYTMMLDAEVPASKMRTLAYCLSGGAPLAASVRDGWNQRYGTSIQQGYGSAEAGMISIQSEDSSDPHFAGRPTPMTDVRILAGDEELSRGEVGEIAVHGPGVVTRYLGHEHGSGSRYWRDYLRTGDLGWMDSSGRLYLSGRMVPWINSGGVKVDPLEVQQAIGSMAGIRECRVEAAKRPGGLDVVAASVVLEPGIELTRADVIGYCRTLLAEYKIPRILQFVPSLAADLTGKSPKPWGQS